MGRDVSRLPCRERGGRGNRWWRERELRDVVDGNEDGRETRKDDATVE